MRKKYIIELRNRILARRALVFVIKHLSIEMREVLLQKSKGESFYEELSVCVTAAHIIEIPQAIHQEIY
jgi:thermostable 8-oxoguanine DNA glycosylase